LKILLTGAGGQLAAELERAAPPDVDLVPLGIAQLDVRRPAAVAATVEAVAPDVVVNAAAYTAVDRAEDAADAAFAVNAEGVAHLATAARDCGARLVHLSTDFVFDGAARRPYRPQDPTAPLSVYGRSKTAGEHHARDILGERCTIVRTSWLYSRFGHNFVRTMLRLMAEREVLDVVDDQEGSPTWAAPLAGVLWRIVRRRDLPGIWHWCDAGSCTWFGFARALQEEALERRLLSRPIELRPIATADFPARARRPAYSVLDATATREALGLAAEPWRSALGRMLDEMRLGELDG
jgi:dTDP-4-dehydrorhamnose reductase